MTSKTHTVVRDMCSEAKGTPSTVGQEATIVVKIPSDNSVVFYDGDLAVGFNPVRYDVYLTTGTSSRLINNEGVVVDRTFVVRLGGVMYEGNDVYTAEELGITE